LDQAGSFLALALSQSSEKGTLNIDGAPKAEAPGNRCVRMTGLAQRKGLFV